MTELANPIAASAPRIYTLSVTTCRFYHPKRGAIFTGVDDEGDVHVITASSVGGVISRLPIKGEIWEIKGQAYWDERYGEQIRAEKCELVRPTHGRLIINWLASHVPGIGLTKAERLYAYFDERSERLDEILDRRQLDRLYEVLSDRAGIPERLLDIWHEKKLETTVIVELDRLGFKTRMANVLLKLWGNQTIDVIRANPYFMLAFVGWDMVDRISQKMGIDAKDERRLIGAVEAAMYRRLDEKHTLTSHARLRNLVSNLLGKGCGKGTAENAIRLASEAKCAIGSETTGWQTRPVSMMESYLMERIPKITKGEVKHQPSLIDMTGAPKADVWGSILDQYGELNDKGAEVVHNVILNFQTTTGHALNRDQAKAVVAAVECPFLVVKGGAGTGKTTVMRVVGDAVEAAGGRVIQMALSGRAKERLKRATKREAITIAKFLRLVATDQLSLEDEPLIIVDEASMIGLSTLFAIISVMPPGARILLVGDPGQLPPIEFGLTFHILADDKSSVPKVELIEIHRQREETGIPSVANSIRRNKLPSIAKYEGAKADGVTFLECAEAEIARKIFEISNTLGGRDEVKVTCATKGRSAGTIAINQLFQSQLAAGKLAMPRESYAEGDPVIWLENDSDRDLYNGTLGIIAEILISPDHEPSLAIQFDDGSQHVIPAEELYKLSLAYAITCHKAQGSSFPRVIIPIVRSRLLDVTLLYTALTRAEIQVVLVGDRNLFESAVMTPTCSLNRQTNFRL